MTQLSEVFDYLNVILYSAERREILRPVSASGLQIPVNVLLHFNQGAFCVGHDKVPAEEGSFYFLASGNAFEITMGDSKHHLPVHQDTGIPFTWQEEEFQKIISPFENLSGLKTVFTAVAFEATLHNVFPMLKLLQLPGISLPYKEDLAFLVKEISCERSDNRLGRSRLLKSYTEELIIRLFRHISSLPEMKKNLERLNFLHDKRLTSMLEYIRANLGGDLSNKRLADICFLSEDYVGQFFRKLTNLSLQDFIENQRLELALHLLNTSSDSVAEIAFAVGFKDPAYFSRRFKLKYDANANAIRNSKSTWLDMDHDKR